MVDSLQQCCMKTKGHLGVVVLFCRCIVVAKCHSLVSYHMLRSVGLKVRGRRKVYILN